MGLTLYTVGFAGKDARRFFETLKDSGIKKLVDVRLQNTSQLAGFTKRDDLAYFADRLCGISYHHLPDLAPSREILDAFRKHGCTWRDFERRFRELMEERGAIALLDRAFFEKAGPSCLLCAEASPAHCHRRLVAEMLVERWPDLEVVHL